MKQIGLERSTTFDPNQVVWRVTTNGWGIWGPFCSSRGAAVRAWLICLTGFQLYEPLIGNLWKTLRSHRCFYRRRAK